MRPVLGLTLALFAAAPVAQPALRIVVIEGEDAVNIIQQKTAVRPVVEVRDRNNLPVPGALVTFSIEGGKAASFGGAATLTVATNAAGQAAVTGLTPSAAGAFQIQVSAAFQGQVATATIAQTNVLAAAAGATGATGATGASGASGAGGLSATTIGIASAAVAGAAVAATQVINQDDEPGVSTFSGNFSGNVVSTLVGRTLGNTCTITRAFSGTATLTLDVITESAVSGALDLSGTDTVVSFTCVPPANANPQFAGRTSVSGTPSAIRGSESRNDTGTLPTGETIQATRTISFAGSLNGNTVTGTMTFETRSVSSGTGGGPVDEATTGTFPLTLTKS